LLTTWLK